MSQSVRQSNLFAAESWEAIYRSFKDIDFRAYDFETIRDSLVDYVRIQYPENFNDYIESSEFIAMIELLAWLGSTLAFRVDLNSRENFLDTAERRESIVRLARMLNYQPKRNIAATGLVKLTAVETNEAVTDSQGRNLSRTAVFWNDPNNPDSFEQFVAVLNAAFASTNQFGRPQKSGTVGSIPTDLYRLSSRGDSDIAYNIGIRIRNETYPIDIVNVDFRDGETFFERKPDPANPFHVIYRNDGEGQGSPNTGFFLHFRQGTLSNTDVSFERPIDNRVLDININNINETDVYVQEIDEDGGVMNQWTRVPSLTGNNIVYNSVNAGVRDIFTVIPRQDDAISLRFADGNFGRVPVGLYRVWHRVSANSNVIIRPEELQNSEIRVPYRGKDGQDYSLKMTFSLVQTVNNAAPTETDEQIKQRASQVYYTQDRMVNGEDYNVFPLTRGNELLKIRAVNRTHAGHSRFIDINDPTGSIQNTIMIGEDGALWADSEPQLMKVSADVPIADIADVSMPEVIRNQFLQNFFYSIYLDQYRENFSVDPFRVIDNIGDDRWYWVTDPERVEGAIGYMSTVPRTPSLALTVDTTTPLRFVKTGCKIKFVAPEEDEEQEPVQYKWVTVRSAEDDSVGTMLELSELVPDGWVAVEVLPAFRRTFSDSELNSLTSPQTPVGKLTLNSRFGLGYDIEADRWYTIDTSTGTESFTLTRTNAGIARTNRNSWLIFADYNTPDGTWVFTSRGRRYVFESADQARFFYDEHHRMVDVRKGRAFKDTIELLSCNSRYDPILPLIPQADPAALIASHLGGSCTIAVGDSCTAQGSLTASITNAFLTVPPYTYRWDHVSGAVLNQGTTIEQTTSSPSLLINVSLTDEADDEGANLRTSIYRLTVTDSQGTELNTGTAAAVYNFVGSALDPIVVDVTGCSGSTSVNLGTACSGSNLIIGGPVYTATGGSGSLDEDVELVSLTLPGGITGTGTYDPVLNRTTVNWTATQPSSGTGVTAAANYRITVSDNGGPGQVTVDRACNVAVTWDCQAAAPPPAPTSRTLTVNSTGASNVPIASNPTTYAGTTNYTRTNIPDGTSIVLTAPATSGSTNFSGWSGCSSVGGSGGRACTINMTQNRTVTASYAAAPPPPPADDLEITNVTCASGTTSFSGGCSGTLEIPGPEYDVGGGVNPVSGVFANSATVSDPAVVIDSSTYDSQTNTTVVEWSVPSANRPFTGAVSVSVAYIITASESGYTSVTAEQTCGVTLNVTCYAPLAVTMSSCPPEGPVLIQLGTPQFPVGSCNEQYSNDLVLPRPALNITGGSGNTEILNPTCSASGEIISGNGVITGSSCAVNNSQAIVSYTLNGSNPQPSWTVTLSITGTFSGTVRDTETNETRPFNRTCTVEYEITCGLQQD